MEYSILQLISFGDAAHVIVYADPEARISPRIGVMMVAADMVKGRVKIVPHRLRMNMIGPVIRVFIFTPSVYKVSN
jgi:hypothetical protein